jgi:hypothetical protein
VNLRKTQGTLKASLDCFRKEQSGAKNEKEQYHKRNMIYINVNGLTLPIIHRALDIKLVYSQIGETGTATLWYNSANSNCTWQFVASHST